MHFAHVSSSPRLQHLLDILIDGAEHSTYELMQKTNSCSVHSDISELRKNNYTIERIYRGKNANGRQMNFYRLIKYEELLSTPEPGPLV